MPPRPHRWWLRLLGGLAGSFLLVALVSFALLQLPEVRARLLHHALDILNSKLQGQLSATDLRLRGLSGIELHQVVLQGASGDTIVTVPQLLITYEAIALTQRRIVVPTVVLNAPTITLIRGRDSLWNIERVLPAQETPGEPPEISIWLRGVSIRDASIIVTDSLCLPGARGILEQGHWHFHKVDFLGSAALFPRQRRSFLSIRSFRFRELFSGVSVDHLHGHLAMTPTHLRADELRLRMPGLGFHVTTELKLDDTARPSSPNTLPRFSQLYGILTVDSLVPAQLARWVPVFPVEVPGTFAALVHFSGAAQTLNIDHLQVHSEHLRLSARLRITAPWDTAHMRLEGVVESGWIPTSLLSLIGPNLPTELDQLVFFRPRALHFAINPTLLEMHGQIQTGIGTLGLRCQIERWASTTPTYSLRLSSPGLSLGKLLAEAPQPLTLAGLVEAEGQGIAVETASARVRLLLTDGHIGKLRLREARLVARLSQGFLQFDTASCRLANADSVEASLTGWVQMLPSAEPTYRLELALSQFPIGPLFQDTTLPESLSLTAQIAGQGIHPDSIEGFVRARVLQVQYLTWTLLPFELALQLSRPLVSARFLQITSEPLTAQVTGNWRMSTLPGILTALATASTSWLAEQKHFLPAAPMAPESPLPLTDSANIRFRIELRDLAWMSHWAALPPLQGALSLDGRLLASVDTAFLQLDRLTGRLLALGNEPTRLHVGWLRGNNMGAGFRLTNGYPELVTIHGDLAASSLQWSEQSLDSVALAWELTGEGGAVKLQLSFAELLHLQWAADLRRYSEGYAVTTRQLSVAHRTSQFVWETPNPFAAHFTSTGISLDTAILERRDREQLRIYGRLAWDSLHVLHAELLRAHLSDISQLVPQKYIRPELSQIKGWIDTLSITAAGPIGMPQLAFRISLRRLHYDTTLLGNLLLSGTADGQRLSGTALLEEGPRHLQLHLYSLPMREELYTLLPVSARIEARNINAALLGPLVPELRNLQGSLNIDASVDGYLPDNLQLSGSVQSQSLMFQLVQTGITYRASLQLHFREQALQIEHFVVQNLPEDLPSGIATLSGTIGLRKLRPWSFDLQFRSPQLLVLNYASARVNPLVYGPLIIATGLPPVQLLGTWEQPQLVGTLLIRTAQLTFPAEALTAASPPSVLADYHWLTPPPAPTTPLERPLSAAPVPTTLRAEP
ncbi:MAG: hypothetical protein RMJ46_03900, partial [Bacteroidota bacterium]|nr:hypothetical protein [Bacteroidota bacterium]